MEIRGNVAGVLEYLEEVTGVSTRDLIYMALYERYPELFASLDRPCGLKTIFILDENEAEWLKALACTHGIKMDSLLRTLLHLTPK